MNSSNRKDIRAAEKASNLNEEQRRNFLCAAMSTVEGRTWFYERLGFCHIFDGTFIADQRLEAFRNGERNVGLKDLNDILAWAPDSYIIMIKEANHVRSTAAQQSRSANRSRNAEGADIVPDVDDFYGDNGDNSGN